MSEIRIFNLTDVETVVLKQHHLVNVTFAVGCLILAPGEMGVVGDDPMVRAHLLHYVTVGAAAVNSLPSSYALAKERTKKPKKPKV